MTKLLQDLPAARKASAEAQAKVKAENAKHTPGPWEAKPTGPWDGWDGWSVEDAAGSVVCDAHGTQFNGAREANARLIAAAPELLYALKACAAVCAGETMSKQGLINALEKARAAISKAQGAPHE